LHGWGIEFYYKCLESLNRDIEDIRNYVNTTYVQNNNIYSPAQKEALSMEFTLLIDQYGESV